MNDIYEIFSKRNHMYPVLTTDGDYYRACVAEHTTARDRRRHAREEKRMSKRRPTERETDPMERAHRGALPGLSVCDIDGVIYRAVGDGVEVILVVETATWYGTCSVDEALAHYLRDISEEGTTRRFQGRLLRRMGELFDCPVLFVVYRRGADLSQADTPLYIARLDAENPRFCASTVGAYRQRIRELAA